MMSSAVPSGGETVEVKLAMLAGSKAGEQVEAAVARALTQFGNACEDSGKALRALAAGAGVALGLWGLSKGIEALRGGTPKRR